MLTIGSVKFVYEKRLGNYILIMRLVVLVPFVSFDDSCEIFGLARPIFVSPLRFVLSLYLFLGRKYFFIIIETSGDFTVEKRCAGL